MNKLSSISTSNAPEALGAYSQAIKANGFIFASGQLGLDPKTGDFISDSAGGQAEQALTNLSAVLKAANSSMDNVVKVSIFLVNINDFAAVNEVYSKFFKAPFPARACVEVSALPKNAKVEIELIATN